LTPIRRTVPSRRHDILLRAPLEIGAIVWVGARRSQERARVRADRDAGLGADARWQQRTSI
jgi:hypothetical protein